MVIYLGHFNDQRWKSFTDITLWEVFVTVACAMFLVMFIVAIVKIGLKIKERLESRKRIEPSDNRFVDYLVVEQVTCSTYFIPVKWDNSYANDYSKNFATRYL